VCEHIQFAQSSYLKWNTRLLGLIGLFIWQREGQDAAYNVHIQDE